jgi:hypothetical protein
MENIFAISESKKAYKLLLILFIFALPANILFSEDLIPYTDSMTGLYGYINSSSKVIFKPEYKSASLFHDGIAIVSKPKDNFSYLINESGRLTKISETYTLLSSFSNGPALTMTKGGFVFINKEGKPVSEKYSVANSFSDGLAIIKAKDKVFAVGKDFKPIFEIPMSPGNAGILRSYDNLYFHDGMMAIQASNGAWGYINSTGVVCIKPIYKEVGIFSSGFAIVENMDGEPLVVDKSGKKIYDIKDSPFSKIQRGLIHNQKLVWVTGNGVLAIVDLITMKEKTLKKTYEIPYGSLPLLLGEKIEVHGLVIDWDGKIIWKYTPNWNPDSNSDFSEEVFNNKYLAFHKGSEYATAQLFTIDGVEIPLP